MDRQVESWMNVDCGVAVVAEVLFPHIPSPAVECELCRDYPAVIKPR